jgi:hypothetical protein
MPTPENLAYIEFSQAVYSGIEGNQAQVAITLKRTGDIYSQAEVKL